MTRKLIALGALIALMAAPLTAQDKGDGKRKAYLGVITAPVGAKKAEQLGLDQEFGLKVVHIAKKSPAEGVLKKGDILLKMGDQKLASHRQLATLIGSAEPESSVSLEIFRDGAKTSVNVVLGEQDANSLKTGKMELFDPILMKMLSSLGDNGGAEIDETEIRKMMETMMDGRDFESEGNGAIPPEEKEKLESMMEKMEELTTSMISTLETGNGASISIKVKNGAKNLVIKDKDGEVVFEGPIDTQEQRAKVPEQYIKMLNDLEAATPMDDDGDTSVSVRVKVSKDVEAKEKEEENDGDE